MSDDFMWAIFDGGTLDHQRRFIGMAGRTDWPDTYNLIPTDETWRHVGDGRYVLVLGDTEVDT